MLRDAQGDRNAIRETRQRRVWSLAELPDGAGVPYLARILARVKYPKVKAKIDAKLNEAAQRAGIGRAELDEISVPTDGLDRDGTRRVAFEQGAAVFRVARNSATLEWFNDAGKPLKSPSKAIKDEKELFKEVQSDLKEMNADLAIQPQRLQQFYLQSRAWPADIWRSRYLDHPLMRGIARKLVWWIDGADGQSVAALADDAGETLLDVAGNPGRAGRCDDAVVASDGCRGRRGRGLARPAGGVAADPALRAGLARGLRADRCRTRHRNLYQPLGRAPSQAAPGHDAGAAQRMARDAPHVGRCAQ